MAEVTLAPGLVLEDDWYAVQRIDERTFAIGEPHYYQQNWSYLLLGDERALLFDTGSFERDITGVVSRRADTAVTALPSHMHFDHLGNVTRFDRVVLADLDVLRAMAPGDVMTPAEHLFLGAWDKLEAPTFAVADWLAIGSTIDLGGRTLELVHTPGHSPDSVSLHEASAKRFYAADFLYGGDLFLTYLKDRRKIVTPTMKATRESYASWPSSSDVKAFRRGRKMLSLENLKWVFSKL